jgi:uncharacterized membrane protein (DUF485 family)
MTTREQTNTRQVTGAWVLRSWIAVALIPVFFLASFMVGYFLYSLFGYTPENMDAPAWVELTVGVVALALFLAPCLAAVFYGWTANKAHDRRGLVPLVIGGILGVWMTVITIISVVAAMLDSPV